MAAVMNNATEEQRNLFFKKYKSEPGNQDCFECGGGNPPWASIPFGILICIDCAGKHRSIGVHLTFVRSLEMDTWTHRQLSMMRVGGNAACKAFFQSYGISDLPLTRKYSSDAAGAYRAKILAAVEAKPWTDPLPEELKKYRISNSVLSHSTSGTSATSSNPGTPIRSSANTTSTSTPPVDYQRYGNVSSFSNNDYHGGGYSNSSYGSGYNGSSYQGYRSGSKGFDFDKITNTIQEEGQKGLSLAVKYFNKAKLFAGNGYGDLDKGHSFASSGGSQYTSNDRFYRINEYQSNRPNYPQNSHQQQPQQPQQQPKSTPQRPQQRPTNSPKTKPTSPPVSRVDEGGWDLSGWQDDQWDDSLQFTTDNSYTPDTSQPTVDIWDFGTRSVESTQTTQQQKEINPPAQPNQTNNEENGKELQTQNEEVQNDHSPETEGIVPTPQQQQQPELILPQEQVV